MAEKLESRNETPLESWKEIAAYLQRDVRTVIRWEKSEGLPVRRHLHLSRASVYAYPSELDAWRAKRRPAEEAAPESWLWHRPARIVAFAAMLLLTLVTAGDGRLLGPASSAAQGEGTVNRLVWAGPSVDILGAPFPDGRHIAITDWETGNLALRETATGKLRRLTDNGNWQGFAQFPVPSPDGKRIAYSWLNNNAQFDLRVFSLDSSGARVVYASDQVDYLQPAAWTPDGNNILTLLSKADRTNQIALIAATDGSARVLKTLDWREPQKMALSPDGRWVVYDFPRKEDFPERDIFLLAADGSREVLLVEHPDNDFVLGWTPDGNKVLFASDRTGRLGIWALPVAEGKAQGPPELVRPDVPPLWAMGFTREGRFYYSVRTGMTDVFLAALDPQTGAVVSAPAPLTNRFVGANGMPDWSPDGKFVAYVTGRGVGVAPFNRKIRIRSLSTGEEREITPALASFRRLGWSPDGRFFLVYGRDAKGRSGFFKVNAQTGEATLVLREDSPGYVQSPAWFPDGKTILYLRSVPQFSNHLWARNLETGDDREIHGAPTNVYAVSPDGRWVVMRAPEQKERGEGLAIIPVQGGNARELFRLGEKEYIPPFSGLAWTPDGKYILFTKTQGGAEEEANLKHPFELWRIPAVGGAPQKIGISMEQIRDLHVHPDGKRIVFSAGQNKKEVWVMENFLPALKAAK